MSAFIVKALILSFNILFINIMAQPNRANVNKKRCHSSISFRVKIRTNLMGHYGLVKKVFFNDNRINCSSFTVKPLRKTFVTISPHLIFSLNFFRKKKARSKYCRCITWISILYGIKCFCIHIISFFPPQSKC